VYPRSAVVSSSLPSYRFVRLPFQHFNRLESDLLHLARTPSMCSSIRATKARLRFRGLSLETHPDR
jgi:hypothetical protein